MTNDPHRLHIPPMTSLLLCKGSPPVPDPLFAGVPPYPLGPAGPDGDSTGGIADPFPLPLRKIALFILQIASSTSKASSRQDTPVNRTSVEVTNAHICTFMCACLSRLTFFFRWIKQCFGRLAAMILLRESSPNCLFDYTFFSITENDIMYDGNAIIVDGPHEVVSPSVPHTPNFKPGSIRGTSRQKNGVGITLITAGISCAKSPGHYVRHSSLQVLPVGFFFQ